MKSIACVIVLCAALGVAGVVADVAYSGGGCFTNGYVGSYATTYAYVQPVVVQAAPVYYSIGQAAQTAATQTYAMRSSADYDEFLRFRAFMAGYNAAQGQAQQQAQLAQSQAANSPNGHAPIRNTPLIVEHCANCHGAQLESPKAGLVLDPRVALTGDQIADIMKRLSLPDNHPDVMPPAPAKLAPEQKGAIIAEVLQLHQKGPSANGQNVPPVPQ